MDWKPIRRGKPRILGVHPQYSGLLQVEVDLDRYPPSEWPDGFEHPEGVSTSISIHPPRLSGATIYIMPPDSELENYIKHIDERISAANTAYERRVLPRVRAAEAAEQSARTENERRTQEARVKLENL